MLNIGVPSRRRCNVGSFDYLLGKVHRVPYEIFDPQLLSISLTPIPRGETLSEISEVLLREVEMAITSEQRFVEEHRHLRELPERPFEARKVELVSVSRRSTVSVGGATYSVPSHWTSLRATA